MSDVFFLIGAPRSATTAYARILDTATNAVVSVEQAPKLRRESRRLIDGLLDDPRETLRATRGAAIESAHKAGLKYGDKNPCYLPFIPHLAELWDCKFILMTRDPRDVMRSMLTFSKVRRGLFARAEDDRSSTITSPDHDPWDYSRLRPAPDDPMHANWRAAQMLEKCAWYWDAFNRRALASLALVGDDRWRLLDVSQATAAEIADVFEFLELTGFDNARVSEMLAARINSVEEKTGHGHLIAPFEDWSKEDQETLLRFAADTMHTLGYLDGPRAKGARNAASFR